MYRFRHWIYLIILSLFAVSCALTISTDNQPAGPTADDVATIVAQTVEAQLSAQSNKQEPTAAVETPEMKDQILPLPVYYLSATSGTAQVWRLETDGTTKTQLTHENGDIKDYDISPTDNSIIFLTNNQLYWADDKGENKKSLIDGGAPDNSDEFLIYKRIGGLLWSPDGVEFAYQQGGLNFYDTSTDENRMAMTVQVRQLENGPLILTETYFPSLWSPDGLVLLLDIAFYEAGTQAVFDPLYNSYIEFQGDHLVCCQSSWFLDSTAVLVGSPWLGMIDAGLWSYNVWTGQDTTLLSTDATNNDINYAGWPIQIPNGDLQYFYHHADQIVDGDTPLVMVRTASDGISGRLELRPDEFIINEALWMPDGSSALIVLKPQTTPPAATPGGKLIFVKVDSSPINELDDQAYDIKWGK